METELSNFCPHWIISVITAQSGIEFLSGSSSLIAIAKKYSRGLSEHYELIKSEYIAGVAEEKLRTLSEIEAAENAVLILNAYVYRRYKFHADNKPRRMTGLFSSEFKGIRSPLPDQKDICKNFKAFIFSIRSNIYNYAPAGWSIIEEPEAQWLGELIAEPASIFDGF